MQRFTLITTVAAVTLTFGAGPEIAALPLGAVAHAQQAGQQSANLTMPQLQALVAPIAHYPDTLLSQVLMAATYPLEVAEAASWQKSNASLKGDALQDALRNQSWDNSVKSLVSFPDALNALGSKLDWTQRLGDAYLAQPKDLFQAVQDLRAKAKQAGNLKSGSQITVTQAPQQEIVIAPTNPQVVYVPTYNPQFVYGAWPYPAYPPAPPYYSGASMAAVGLLSFGAGMAVGAALWSTPHWGSGSITVNNANFNNFNHSFNSANNMSPERSGGESNWNYNAAHRDGVPYSNSALNNRYGNPAERSQIERNNAERYQGARNDWNQKASPQEKQQAQDARQRASSDWNDSKDNRSSSQDRSTNADRSTSADRSSSAQRSSAPDRSGSAGRSDSERSGSEQRSAGERSGGDRSGGERSGGFGGGHFGGFRR